MNVMFRKYAWHPSHRPPPAEPSVAGRIAMMGPVGRCLEDALDELLAEDDNAYQTTADNGNDDSESDNSSSGSSSRDLCESKKRKRCNIDDKECENSKEKSRREALGVSETETEHPDNNLRLDSSMSKSILEAYGSVVAKTEFDPEERNSSNLPYTHTTEQHKTPSKVINHTTTTKTAAATTAAPAALLRGEIDHYNRVGGQWRIVVKNAILKPRTFTTVDNGMTGRSMRKRPVLDWDDDDDEVGTKRAASSAGALNGKNDVNESNGNKNASDVHHFKGTVQILAYDDDT